jgi:hypothetical protein
VGLTAKLAQRFPDVDARVIDDVLGRSGGDGLDEFLEWEVVVYADVGAGR